MNKNEEQAIAEQDLRLQAILYDFKADNDYKSAIEQIRAEFKWNYIDQAYWPWVQLILKIC